jgi:hypothetical protein
MLRVVECSVLAADGENDRMDMQAVFGAIDVPLIRILCWGVLIGLLGGGWLLMVCVRGIGKNPKATYWKSVGAVALAGFSSCLVLILAAKIVTEAGFDYPQLVVPAVFVFGAAVVLCLPIWVGTIKFMFSVSRGRAILTCLPVLALAAIGVCLQTVPMGYTCVYRPQLPVRIRSLDDGATIYKLSATGNKYYPGQDPEGIGALETGASPEKYPNCQNAGSALLARYLFTDPNGVFPVSWYGQFEKDMLGTVAGVPGTLVDFRDPPMAILYFPARLDKRTGKERFVLADNARYLNSDNCPQDANKILAQWDASSGTFLIVTAGPSGKYFTKDSDCNVEKK